MFRFFDYVYYRTCIFYNKSGEKTSYRISGLVLLSVLQVLNLLFLFQLTFTFLNYWPSLNKYIAVILYVIFLILDGIRYNKLNYDVLRERWANEDAQSYQRKGIWVVLYILLSVLLVIVLIIVKANNR
jgi:hypothetical protein